MKILRDTLWYFHYVRKVLRLNSECNKCYNILEPRCKFIVRCLKKLAYGGHLAWGSDLQCKLWRNYTPLLREYLRLKVSTNTGYITSEPIHCKVSDLLVQESVDDFFTNRQCEPNFGPPPYTFIFLLIPVT